MTNMMITWYNPTLRMACFQYCQPPLNCTLTAATQCFGFNHSNDNLEPWIHLHKLDSHMYCSSEAFTENNLVSNSNLVNMKFKGGKKMIQVIESDVMENQANKT